MKPERSLFSVLTRTLVLYSAVASLFFLCGIVWLYQLRLQEQRADAGQRLNLLLQVSLENAMLKRDIPGLMDIVTRLGQQSGVDTVAITNPQGEVRFSSRPELLGRKLDFQRADLCPDCQWDGKTPIERSDLIARGFVSDQQVLRSIRSVSNRVECSQCHGDAAANPVNGLLIVDHAAQDLRHNALISAMGLAGSGIIVVLGLVGGVYATLRRHVLNPVSQLRSATEAWSDGDYSARVAVSEGAEIAALERSFNAMAERLQLSLRETKARERFVQALIEALPDGVRVLDPDFRIVLANGAYHRIHGLEPESAIGTRCYCSSHGRSEPCVPTLNTCPVVMLKAGNTPIRFQASHRARTGGDVSVEVHAAAVDFDSPAGHRTLIIEIIRDLDAALQISHEQRLSELGQLATGVAHEIRNPLSSISILLHNITAEGAARASDENVRMIGQEIDRCLAITESLLKLGSPPASDPQLLDLGDLSADMLRLLRFQAEEDKVTLVADVPRGLRVLAADNDMRIVMINLIQNAFHAMRAGGSLTISGARTPGGTVTLRFADTGIGIPAADLRAIFLPFWSRRADGVHGTGLGLSICRSIIRAAGGDIQVSSVQGSGTVFTIELPDADFETDMKHGD